MPSASFSISTTRSPDDVFAYLADLRNTTAWMPSIVDSVELVAGEPGEAGARFLVTNERSLFDDIVVDYKTIESASGALLVFATKHPKLEGTDTYRLTPTAGGGTDVEYASQFTYTGINKVATPFGAAVIKAITGGLGNDLKAQLEHA